MKRDVPVPAFSPEESARVRAALRSDAPDARAFDTAVRAAIAEAAQRNPERPDESTGGATARRAASLLPFLASTEPARVAGASASKWSLASLLVVLSLPVVILPMLILTFVVGLTRASRARHGTPTLRRDQTLRWWREHRAMLFVILGLFGAAMFTSSITAFSYLMGASMLAFGWMVVVLTRGGYATRERLAMFASWGLFYAGWFAWILGIAAGAGRSSGLPYAVVPFVLVVGGALCQVLPPERQLRHGLASLPFLFVAVLFGSRAFVSTLPPQDRLAAKCSHFDRDILSQPMWRQWALAVEWLGERGISVDLGAAIDKLAVHLASDADSEAPPPTEHAVETVANWLRNGDPAGRTIVERRRYLPSYELGNAVHCGVVTAARAAELLEIDAKRAERLLRQQDSISHLGQAKWLIDALLLTERLSSSEKDALAQRLHASWPDPGAFDAISTMRQIAALCRAIDRPLDPASFGPRVHAQLRGAWCERAAFRSGGFKNSTESTSSDAHTTHDAVRLLAEFGVDDPSDAERAKDLGPPIDLYAVRSYLASEARPLLPFGSQHWMQIEAGLALDRLENEVGLPRRSLWTVLLAEHMVIGSVLLVLLAAVIIRSAPAGTTPGAPPP